MKKILLIASLLTLATATFAQELTESQQAAADVATAISDAPAAEQSIAPKPKYWTNSLSTNLTFGQTALVNWAAGGFNTITLKALVDGNANYAKDKLTWNNRLQLNYGLLWSADKPVLQKSDDKIYLESKFGYNIAKNLFASAEFNFKSQFSNTYNYNTPKAPTDAPEDWKAGREEWRAARSLKSSIFAPAYTNLALGLSYDPFKWWSINFAPLTGGYVITSVPELRKNYGMKYAKQWRQTAEDFEPGEYATYEDYVAARDALGGKAYQAARFEFGAQLKMDFKVNVNDYFKYKSQVVLFTDYLNEPNVRFNFDNMFEFKIAKYFSLVLNADMIYDSNVLIYSEKDGLTKKRFQFMESLSFGFTYSIATKK